tara:strand:- start:743 stop:2095 length:1353 start_codon:yes stop_codon:yes gene_type:complete
MFSKKRPNPDPCGHLPHVLGVGNKLTIGSLPGAKPLSREFIKVLVAHFRATGERKLPRGSYRFVDNAFELVPVDTRVMAEPAVKVVKPKVKVTGEPDYLKLTGVTEKTLEHFSHIPDEMAERMDLGFEELNWLYGKNPGQRVYGAPRGGIAAWAGSQGIGKTRACIQVCKNVLMAGGTVLFFTLEMNKAQFRSQYCKGLPPTAKFYISDKEGMKEQLEDIARVRPDLVVVDSINEIPEYRNGLGAKAVRRAYLPVVTKTKSHVIFISQLNAAGSVKGGTYLGHMVDTVFHLTEYDSEIKTPIFCVNCPTKNRYGSTNKETYWSHNEDGVACDSFERHNDAEYVADTGDAPAPKLGISSTKKPNRAWWNPFAWGKPLTQEEIEDKKVDDFIAKYGAEIQHNIDVGMAEDEALRAVRDRFSRDEVEALREDAYKQGAEEAAASTGHKVTWNR